MTAPTPARKISRYAFFALCAVGVGLIAAMVARGIGIDRDFEGGIFAVVGVASFHALRDMLKGEAA